MTVFNYDSAQAYAKSLGICIMPDKLAEFDQLAAAHGFTQAQVDVSMQLQIRQISWMFSPKNYNWRQRIALALWFLSGRKQWIL